ncbi:MAG: helical backbone metal receptor [PVC group bacterium]
MRVRVPPPAFYFHSPTTVSKGRWWGNENKNIYQVISDNRKIVVGFSLALLLFLLGFAGLSTADEEIAVIDSTGTKLSFTQPPERIVSLNPDFTENAAALGAAGHLVGITDYCRWPEKAAAPKRVGGLWHPNLERIVALRPDLVLATREGNDPETVAAIRGLSISVYVAGPPAGFNDYFAFLGQLGLILDREAEAGTLIASMTSLIDRLRAEAAGRPRKTVFFQIGMRPLITAGKGTLINEMIDIAGGKNIAGDLSVRYPAFSRERVLAADPGVIIIAAAGSEAEEGTAFWKTFPELRAVRSGRVFAVNPDDVCRLGPGLMEGLKQIAACIRGEGDKE